MPRTHSVFQRLPIAEGGAAFEETESLLVRLLVRLLAGRRFHNVLGQHMGYCQARAARRGSARSWDSGGGREAS